MEPIVIELFVAAPPADVYDAFLNPHSLKQWYTASPDWETPYAEVDPVPGGKLRIGFRHKTAGHEFDFSGTFEKLVPDEYIEYTLDDKRKVVIELLAEDGGTSITETFDPEETFPRQEQINGWTALLESLKAFLLNRAKAE